MYELILLGFTKHALVPILDDACVGVLNLSSGSSRSIISNCVRAFVHLPVIFHESVHLPVVFFGIFLQGVA